MKAGRLFPGAAALVLALAGCATPPKDPDQLAAYKADNDPLEPMNRRVFAFNLGVDRCVIKPVAQVYVRVVPKPGRDGLHNLLQNFGEPVVFGNDLLQGDLNRANVTLGRFLLNSTLGLAGIFDVAKKSGLAHQTGDFGQTLHVWGAHEGPYLVLPILGPSSPRDGVGRGVDMFLDPFRYVAAHAQYPTGLTIAEFGAAGIDERSRNLDALDVLQRDSIDFYASFRSLYRQNRAAELKTGREASAPPPAGGLYDDPGNP